MRTFNFWPIVRILLYFILAEEKMCAQPESFYNFKDEAGRKWGKWYERTDKDTSLWEIGAYIEDKRDGPWALYNISKSSTVREVTYVNGRLNGPVKIYYSNHVLKEEGTWEINKWVGSYKSYWDNGCLYNECNFNRTGKRDSLVKYYYREPCNKIWKKVCSAINKDIIVYYDTTGHEVRIDTFKTYTLEAPRISFPVGGTKPDLGQGKGLGLDSLAMQGGRTVVTDQESIIYSSKGLLLYKGHIENGKLLTGYQYVYSKKNRLIIRVYKDGNYIGDAYVPTEK